MYCFFNSLVTNEVGNSFRMNSSVVQTFQRTMLIIQGLITEFVNNKSSMMLIIEGCKGILYQLTFHNS